VQQDRERQAKERLETMLIEGLESGPAEPMTAQDWEKIRMAVRERTRLNRVKQGYETLLNFLKAEALLQNVAVVVTPVQTVGTVVFSHVEVKDGKPFFWFHQTNNPKYNPIDSEQPLRYILRFLLKKYTERKGLRSWLGKLFGQDEPFKQAVAEIAKGCKNGDGFAVLQGQNLLNR